MEKVKTLKEVLKNPFLENELREAAKVWIEDLWETPMEKSYLCKKAELETMREVEGAKKVLEFLFSLEE